MMYTNLVKKADQFAEAVHSNQIRKYNRHPYIEHPRQVMELTAFGLGLDATEDVLAGALLHDVVEDCNISLERIKVEFNFNVAHIVHGMTKIIVPGNRADRKRAERIRLSMESYEVKTVKLADVISNTMNIAKYDIKFATTYVPEQRMLLEESLRDGNPTLVYLAELVISSEENHLP